MFYLITTNPANLPFGESVTDMLTCPVVLLNFKVSEFTLTKDVPSSSNTCKSSIFVPLPCVDVLIETGSQEGMIDLELLH
jgi:hypothetical protein